MDAERRDEWARWALDKLIENWKAILAVILAGGFGAAAATVVSPGCPECVECPTQEEKKAACIMKIDNCLDLLTDLP